MTNLRKNHFLKKLKDLRENYWIWVNKIEEEHKKGEEKRKRSFGETPPAQDSSKHILNILTDECIQKILSHFECPLDFFNAAETCTRFQNNAKICFPSEFNSFAITIEEDEEESGVFPLHSVPKYLATFGYLINYILWSNRIEIRALDDGFFRIIAESCGRSLTKFEIFGEHELEFNTSPPFYVLEELRVRSSSIIKFDFSPFTALKTLLLSNVKIKHFEIPNNELPTLESILVDSVEGLTDELLIRLLECVPQLKVLHVHYCMSISTSIFQNVEQRIPNLEELDIISGRVENAQDILELGKLEKLKYLRLNFNKISTVQLVDLLAEREVPIEELSLAIPSLSESLYRFSKLKFFRYHIPIDTAPELLTKIPTLEQITIRLKPDSTASDIIEFIEYAFNYKIKNIKFIAKKISIDMESYLRILALSKNRIQLWLSIEENLADLNDDVVEANREFIHIYDTKKENDPEYWFKREIAALKVCQQEVKDRYCIYDVPDFI